MNLINFSELWAGVTGSSAVVWLTSDPTGQRCGLGIALLALIAATWLIVKFGRTIAQRCKHIPRLLLVVGAAYYAAVLLLKLDPAQWAPAAALVALSLLVVGLAGAALRQRSKGSPKAKPA